MTWVCIEDHWTYENTSLNSNKPVLVPRGFKTEYSIQDKHDYTFEVLININGLYYSDLIKYYVELSEWVKLCRDDKLNQII